MKKIVQICLSGLIRRAGQPQPQQTDKQPELAINRITADSGERKVMVLTVTPPIDLEGKFEETIPDNTNIVWQGPAVIANG